MSTWYNIPEDLDLKKSQPITVVLLHFPANHRRYHLVVGCACCSVSICLVYIQTISIKSSVLLHQTLQRFSNLLHGNRFSFSVGSDCPTTKFLLSYNVSHMMKRSCLYIVYAHDPYSFLSKSYCGVYCHHICSNAYSRIPCVEVCIIWLHKYSFTNKFFGTWSKHHRLDPSTPSNYGHTVDTQTTHINYIFIFQQITFN